MLNCKRYAHRVMSVSVCSYHIVQQHYEPQSKSNLCKILNAQSYALAMFFAHSSVRAVDPMTPNTCDLRLLLTQNIMNLLL